MYTRNTRGGSPVTRAIFRAILDSSLRVHSANRAFYQTFHVSSEETENRLIYELGNAHQRVWRQRRKVGARGGGLRRLGREVLGLPRKELFIKASYAVRTGIGR